MDVQRAPKLAQRVTAHAVPTLMVRYAIACIVVRSDLWRTLMNLRKSARQLPLRLATGGFVLSSGLSMWGADEPTAKQLAAFAAGTYPFLAKFEPRLFVKALSVTEITVGAAVLLPFAPRGVAAAGLAAFSAGTIGLYLRTPGMRREGSLQPTEEGIALAKDVWLVAIAVSLIVDDLVGR